MKTIQPSKWVYIGVIVCITLLFSLSSRINFYQNDDYIYYGMVQQFLSGNWQLHPYVAATFYVQGFLGVGFSSVFGMQSLPVLTMAFYLGSMLIFGALLQRVLGYQVSTSKFKVALLSLLVFGSPLLFYSALGFMTESYYLFFLLLALYFVVQFGGAPKARWILYANAALICGFYVRQITIALFVAFCLYLLFNKWYRWGAFQVLLTLVLLILHYEYFPLTPVMYESGLEFSNLLSLEYVAQFLISLSILLCGLLIPLFLDQSITAFLRARSTFYSHKKILVLILCSIALIWLVFYWFDPVGHGISQFPYFGNTFDQKGLLPRDLHGEKYHFFGIFDLYYWWESVAKVVLITSIIGIVSGLTIDIRSVRPVLNRLLSNIYFWYVVSFVGLLIISPHIFDRYLISLVPFVSLLIVSTSASSTHSVPMNLRLSRVVLMMYSLFVFALLFLTYQYSMDYIGVNTYIWSRSTKLVTERSVAPYQISSGNAWLHHYGLDRSDVKYFFSYDASPNLLNVVGPKKGATMMEVTPIDYPLNIHVNPVIYLFEVTDL